MDSLEIADEEIYNYFYFGGHIMTALKVKYLFNMRHLFNFLSLNLFT